MTEKRILLDPTAERSRPRREPAPRPAKLDGLIIGLLDISKARGDVFLDRLEFLLRERGLETRRYRKLTFARVAPVDLRLQIKRECDLVIEALAD